MVSYVIKQSWICVGLFADFIGHGMMMSYSSCLLPGLRAADSTIKVDIDSESWLASGIGIPMIFSFFITPIFLERFGRRWIFTTNTLILIMAWLIIYWATGVATLMLGRLVGGIAIAGIYCSGSLVIAEYSAPSVRGVFLNIKTSLLGCGVMIIHIAGNYLHWRTVALISIMPCAISLLNSLTWPESPSWLASKNRFEECTESFYQLRGRSDKAVKELESMIQAQKIRMTMAPQTVLRKQKVVIFLKKFKQKNFLQPLLLILFCEILCETSGRHFFPAYAVDIVMEITKDTSNQLFYIIGVDIVTLISGFFSCILIKVIGRKSLLLFSGISSTALIIIISIVMFLISKGYALVGDPWLVPLLVGVYFIFANLGCSAIPFVVYGEVFPMEHREAGAGIGGALLCFGFFLIVKILPYSLKYLKLYGTFAVFAVGMIISIVYLYFMMPETRNKTLLEIEEFFEHGRFLNEEERKSNNEDAKEFMLTRAESRVTVVPSNS